VTIDPPTFTFVIDTEHYAGSFQRQMCAYVTGEIGECGVGDDMQEIARAELDPEPLAWFDRNIESQPDDHGCHRPTGIHPTPGWFNSGMGQHHRDEEWGQPHVTEEYREALREYAEKHKDEKRLKEAETAEPGRHAAYQSVAIYLGAEPPSEIAQLMMERARKFATTRPDEDDKSWIKERHPLTITGFRLVQEKTIEAELASWPAGGN
jgi:hypothetical protein